MLIDYVFPEIVAQKSTLRQSLEASLLSQGRTTAEIQQLLAHLPSPLVDARAFLDRLTNLWRYEFGSPYVLNGELMFGAHMWLPVDHLRHAATAASARVPHGKRAAYFARLANPDKHWVTQSEMMPGARLHLQATVDFEVAGVGAGAKTVDWSAQFNGRSIVFDVKSRHVDLIKQAGKKGVDGVLPEPDHDPALLFRGVAEKFEDADPDVKLQGAWITSHVKQSRSQLEKAFHNLPNQKVHFAILGDWEDDIYLLVRRQADVPMLLELFTARLSDRFVFDP